MTDAAYESLISSRPGGVLVTIFPDGRPQLSNVSHTYDPAARLLRVSVTDGRVKTRNLRRDPRASYHVASENSWLWCVAEGTVTFSDVATTPDDAAVADVFGTFPVVVAVILIRPRSTFNTDATTCATLVLSPWPISVPP